MVFIGKGLADAMDVKVGDRFTLAGRATHGQMRQRSMTVGGIYDVGMGDIEKRKPSTSHWQKPRTCTACPGSPPR